MPYQEIADWIKVLGIIAYAGCVGLSVLWAGIGVTYLRAGHSRRTWLFFIACMLAFAIMFSGLTFVAAEPVWVNRTMLSVAQRVTAILAVVTGGIYTYFTLRNEWRNEH